MHLCKIYCLYARNCNTGAEGYVTPALLVEMLKQANDTTKISRKYLLTFEQGCGLAARRLENQSFELSPSPVFIGDGDQI